MKKNWIPLILLGLVIVIADRVTKQSALARDGATQSGIPGLSFEPIFNRGISFGLCASENEFVFMCMSIFLALITAFLCAYALYRYQSGQNIVGEMMVIAGSCGNLYDRFYYGGVVDFIELSYHGWAWPSFNIADAMIVLGVCGMFFSYARES